MKTFSLISIFLWIFASTTFPIPSHAENPPIQNQTQSQTLTELQSIDRQINSLNKDLARIRKEALNQEINAQQYMIDNWQEFAENISLNETSEKEILEIKEKIKTLNDRKAFLLKQSSNPHQP